MVRSIKDHETNITFLIDSGSDVLPKSFLYNKRAKPEQTFSAANGSSIDVFGLKLLKVSVGFERTFYQPFIVANVTKPIIGVDFLGKFGILVDVKFNRIVDSTTNFAVEGNPYKGVYAVPKFFAIDNEFGNILKE